MYVIDKDNLRYKRTPINECTPHSPRIAYGEWLPLADIPEPVTLVNGGLKIMHETSVYGIFTSPICFSIYGVSPDYMETGDGKVYV